MVNDNPLRRVTRDAPCAICGKPDWCSATEDMSLALCMRIADGASRRAHNSAWVHKLRDAPPNRWTPPQVKLRLPPPDLTDHVAHAVAQTPTSWLRTLVHHLHLPADTGVAALRELRVHRRQSQSQTSGWPMQWPTGRTTGVRYRSSSGAKFSLKGGEDALFAGAPKANVDMLFICEGGTDTAAGLAIGLAAIGRPSAAGGGDLVCEFVRRYRPAAAVVMADRDGQAARFVGQSTAQALAERLALICQDVRVILPPPGAKDLRAAVAEGARRHDLLQLVAQANPVEVTLA